MTIKTLQTNQTDDTKRRAFAPIRGDLLERLTRQCDNRVAAPWRAPKTTATGSLRVGQAR